MYSAVVTELLVRDRGVTVTISVHLCAYVLGIDNTHVMTLQQRVSISSPTGIMQDNVNRSIL